MSLPDQLFHSIVALNLNSLAEIRPLTAKEKSILEQSEAIGGELYNEAAASVERIKKDGAPWTA